VWDVFDVGMLRRWQPRYFQLRGHYLSYTKVGSTGSDANGSSGRSLFLADIDATVDLRDLFSCTRQGHPATPEHVRVHIHPHAHNGIVPMIITIINFTTQNQRMHRGSKPTISMYRSFVLYGQARLSDRHSHPCRTYFNPDSAWWKF
jgi:hypothetical protein